MAVSKQSELPRRIFMSGMFDMRNFGDLMFPLIARQRLAGMDIVPVSPTGNCTGFADALPSIPLSQMMTGGGTAHGILIGGGYMIHGHKMHFLEEYASGGLRDYAGPGLWLGATLTAAVRDIPIAWNAPGVPHPFASSHHPLVDAAVCAADYCSVRDKGSLELLAPPIDAKVRVVPDPVAGIAQFWSRHALEAPFKNLLARKGSWGDARYLALHFRNRSLAKLGVPAAATAIDLFSKAQGLVPILVAVGQTHDDDVLAREIASHLTAPHILLDDPVSLMEIAAVFAQSSLYIGASLHGYIAAAAYDVPAVLVALPSYRKFQGFVDHSGRGEDLAKDWPHAFAIAGQRANRPTALPDHLLGALDRHWRRIEQAFSDLTQRRNQRLSFLQQWLRRGAEIGGDAWPHLPFTQRGAE
ncbi:MAG: polysaccharide pyruvyl transferase family protein [Alphaproteobacteria bacterium]|nr:polysaccharide pyruvyl transferase family protein [Alphaproteobacteria bacterium]